MNDGLVVIPTYNEIENISSIINAIFNLEKEFHILVVDDNSPDGTAEEVEILRKTIEYKLFLLKRPQKEGLGRAYLAGFKWALEEGYEYIFEMDADFSHNPKDLVRLYNCCLEGNDIAIGSRYVKGINVVNWPLTRILISYGASLYVRFITKMNIKDVTSGFICYKSNVLKSINLNDIKYKGYAFQIEMKYKAQLKGFKIKEISIIFKNREKGISKMNSKIIWEAVFGVLYLKFLYKPN